MIGKKKKLIVPVVAIMMCAVALAGVAYALNTTVSNNGGMDAPDVYTIDLYNNATGTTLQTAAYAVNGFTFYTDKTVGGDLFVKVNPDTSAIIGYVGAKDESGNFVAASITASIDLAAGYSAGVFTKVGDNLVGTIDGTTVTIGVTVVDGTTANVKAIKMTISTSGATTTETDANLAAKAVADAVDALTYTMTFSAPLA